MKFILIRTTVFLLILLIACDKKEEENAPSVEKETGTVTDYDGNNYKTIKLGSQWWMAQNLKTTHYSDGTAIPLVESNTDWSNLEITDKAYCYLENSIDNGKTYGALYTWSAVMNGQNGSDENPSGVQGVCPEGWHVPSDDEWKQLELFLGMSQSEVDNSGWRGTNEGSKLAGNSNLWTNDLLKNDPEFGSTGFNALPGGFRFTTGVFTSTLQLAGFITASETDSLYTWFRELGYYNDYTPVEKRNGVRRNGYSLKGGGSYVRCVKDLTK